MVNRPDRVQVWASQLAANAFPPVCAMSGRPAETWRKFNFATPPAWAYSLLILVCVGGIGFIAYAIVMAVTAYRARGFLPLTRSSSRTVALLTWLPLVLLISGVVLWTVAAVIGLPTNDPIAGTIAGVLFWLGLFAFGCALVGRLLLKPLMCPRAKVTDIQPGTYDRLVELQNVHPAFVMAVNRMHAVRAAQQAAAYSPPSLPQMPGST